MIITTEDAGLYIAGVGAYLPPRQTAAEAIAAGHYDPVGAEADDIASICVEPQLFPAEMAAAAGRDALAMAADTAGEVRALIHSYVDYQGAHFWQAAPHVALHTVGAEVPSFDVVQECNGGLGSMELARRFITGPGDAVLLTTGDRFDNPWIRRWHGDQSMFADGGSALLLSGTTGFARITAMVTMADNSLEAEPRGGAFGPVSDTAVDFDRMRERFHTTAVPMLDHYQRLQQVLRDCVSRTFEAAETTADKLAYVVPTVTTKWRTQIQLERFVGVPLERSTWEFGRTVGHIGSGDQFLGLHHLVTTGKVRRGDRVLLIGGGTGYTITAAVVEIVADL
ncbi:ketoacyl-ACP synthase III family protein [Nocardia transvalensis]|uniref:ketoacyl-ACP synthase III family protein n=1 Tax=Nocardia transvalensis TaxID=37333 RepID=UPI0018943331|nr:ketoacyl-ACP synthase III family protein [Nocardia transvalensis]MBF6329429.1 ketoacyl-ACP synthase III family protein [Nocardia transvalensis]